MPSIAVRAAAPCRREVVVEQGSLAFVEWHSPSGMVRDASVGFRGWEPTVQRTHYKKEAQNAERSF